MKITSKGKKLVVDCEGMQFNLKNGQDTILTVNNKNHEAKEDTEVNNGYFVHPGGEEFGAYLKGDDRYRYVCPKDETTGVYLDTEKNRIVLIDNTPVG